MYPRIRVLFVRGLGRSFSQKSRLPNVPPVSPHPRTVRRYCMGLMPISRLNWAEKYCTLE